MKITEIYNKIYQTYPQLISVNFSIANKNVILEKNKRISDYGIGYQNNNYRVTVVGIPDYLYGPEGVIKMMKTNGEWVYDAEMIKFLKLEGHIAKFQPQYGQSNSKVMTAAVVGYLKRQYPELEDEYKLIYRKAEKFLSK